MKKMLIVIFIMFILTSILTVNFTLQAALDFQDFEDDGNGDDDDDDTIIPQIIIHESAIPTNGRIERYDDFFHRNIVRNSLRNLAFPYFSGENKFYQSIIIFWFHKKGWNFTSII